MTLTNHLAIDARGLKKQFGGKTAVSDFTLQVKRGDVFGFLGPNGAGKTTSVKMLLSLLKPTAGSASLLGQPLGNRITRQKIGFLPEHFRFHEWLKAAEFLDLHGRLFGIAKHTRKQKIPQLLSLVGLENQFDAPLRTFSKGMLQRIGLAQALLNDPELVFLDEPTSGLDPLGRRLVRDIINQLRERGTAVFLNSHLLSEVEQTCDRVAFIREGSILQTTTLTDFASDTIQIVLRVGQPTEKLMEELREWDSQARWHDGNGRFHLTLPSEAHLPQLANWLIANGHTLYELSPHALSLEEQFLRIIGSDA
ncbi:MAG: ABC transporter ATP-binding protein [Chloroflexi bacterium]|nr:MAG: ABC transporter ATP-binding protein [Chloroflexota bacterium]